ncbi:hypothetical protein D1007_03124 [Hordeum vulgare]|nr:hypothetical protein D1007_03124 [Hordeum vulgare]
MQAKSTYEVPFLIDATTLSAHELGSPPPSPSAPRVAPAAAATHQPWRPRAARQDPRAPPFPSAPRAALAAAATHQPSWPRAARQDPSSLACPRCRQAGGGIRGTGRVPSGFSGINVSARSPRAAANPAAGECSYSTQEGSPLFQPGPGAAPSSAPLQPTDRPRLRSPRPAVNAPRPDPAVAETPLPSRRLRSIVVAPLLPISGLVGKWSEVARRRGRVASADPSVPGQPWADKRQHRPSGRAATPPAFLSQFRGRCFRCLSSKHRRAEWRDPIHCILCRRAGHIARSCPRRRLPPGAPVSAHSRLGPPAPGQPLQARVCFPPPPVAPLMSPLKPTMLHHIDPARWPRDSRSVVVPSPAVDQAIFFLRNHAVTLSAADGVNASSPMAVGRALEAQLAVPEHSLRVTAHHPEHYLVIFSQPTQQVNALRRASIQVDGAVFNVASWHEHDHASFGSLLLHVRVIIEGVPMHL